MIPTIFFIQYFTILVVHLMMSSLSYFAYCINLNISTTKRHFKEENVMFLYFEKPSKYAATTFMSYKLEKA